MAGEITDRLTPFVTEYQRLTIDNVDECSDEEMEKARRILLAHDLWTIPMLEKLCEMAIAEADRIVKTDIPCLLAEYGLAEATMLDGTTVSKATFYETSQANKDKNVLSNWLELNGYGSIIKDTLALDKGEFDPELESFLNEHGYSYKRDSNVNGQTLKKTIKDHILAGGSLPPEEGVKVSIFECAVVKSPKESKGF